MSEDLVESLEDQHRERVLEMRKMHRDYAVTFDSTAEGRAVLDHLRTFCRADLPVFVPGDPHATAYQDGCRRVILHIEKMMSLSEEDIVQITREPVHEIDEETGI